MATRSTASSIGCMVPVGASGVGAGDLRGPGRDGIVDGTVGAGVSEQQGDERPRSLRWSLTR